METLATVQAGRAEARDPAFLRARIEALWAEQPMLRPRDAAALLQVSEAELLAARCGDGVRRLDGRWEPLIKALPGLGRVMVLTRNEHAVHEKVGRFDKISVVDNRGLVLDPDIDLRLFLDHWHFGFAVSEQTRSGPRQSLQIFDLDGVAVHKIYLREDSDDAAYAALVEAHLSADQSPGQAVLPSRAPAPDRPDGEVDAAGLRERWRALQDVHHFFPMLRDLGVGRLQAFRLAGPGLARAVGPGSFRAALERAAAASIPVMVFVGSPGVIQIHTGPVRTLKQVGPWFNVLDPGFNLHLREDGIDSAWLVRKPTRDGDVTSIEIFDAAGRQIAWMFGQRKPGEAEREDWRALLDAVCPAEA